MSDVVILVGEKIRALRQHRGLSQEKLAFKAGINTSYIGQVERGEKSATIISLEKIATALDVGIEELFQFDKVVAERADSSFIERIAYELKGRTKEEQEDIYSFVKQLLWFRDKK
ncbi:transcriptional regulator [Paenibacillus baekrokdamisoli]|uniref:Transcriptional regulator n=1 Tax=Paenibacillus baekrokdamisoli TaxID=1712516 RepID=A0A3G9IUY8_9BACL|nr:helix-turn-helix transcriptional regulator [Paenibacillus baekrokdamisoli]MBB3068348.1 transcriptional regulator with XRE-family HTH domain [Paenibacillus baekrokdamisoli]BBH22610.1 transcriptional regulator [Paenibacillus baekrokdamisoli]